jgi:hypothetical protein
MCSGFSCCPKSPCRNAPLTSNNSPNYAAMSMSTISLSDCREAGVNPFSKFGCTHLCFVDLGNILLFGLSQSACFTWYHTPLRDLDAQVLSHRTSSLLVVVPKLLMRLLDGHEGDNRVTHSLSGNIRHLAFTLALHTIDCALVCWNNNIKKTCH